MSRIPPMAGHAITDIAGFEMLERRSLLSSFLYHDLGSFLDPFDPLYVLRPAGEHAPARTIASAVDAAGDVNGDGHADVIVGSGGVMPHGGDHERAVAAIFSGATGEALFTFSDGFSEFGAAVAGIGDVNGDGTPDVLVGSPRWDSDMRGSSRQVGRAYIHSGADGTLLRTLTGEADGDRFGAAAAAAGDFNNDGTPDVIVGATGADAGGRDRGRVYVFSGADGSLLAMFSGFADHAAFGYAVSGAGDLNADSFADVIVGTPGAFAGNAVDIGRAFVFSGQDHSVLFSFFGSQSGDRFGFAVDGAGDVNADGTPDLLIGAPNARVTNDGDNIPAGGIARVFSGADGAALMTFRGNAPNGNLGAAVAGAGDLNGDGHADFLIAVPAASRASHVAVYSGATGEVLARFSHADRDLVGGDRLSTSVAVAGDVDADGFADFVFAATQDSNPERNDRSRMYIFSGIEAAGLLPDGFNDDLDIWGTAGGDGMGMPGEGWLVLNGDLFLLRTRDGFMPGDRVIDVNDEDTVLGVASDGTTFTWQNGTRTTVADLVMMEDGPMGTFGAPVAVDITDSGLILTSRQRDDGMGVFTPTAWLLESGTITYLFDGAPLAMNEARSVIALPADPMSLTGSLLWTPDDGLVELDGIRVVDLNENTVLVGTAEAPMMPGSLRTVIWTDGDLMRIGTIDGGDDFVPTGINNDRHIVGNYTVMASGDTSGFFYSEATGILDIKSCIQDDDLDDDDEMDDDDYASRDGDDDEDEDDSDGDHDDDDDDGRILRSRDISLVGINNNGWVLGRLNDFNVGFLLEPFDGNGPFSSRRDVRIVATLPDAGGLSVVAINRAGEVILFRRDDSTGRWTAVDLSEAARTPHVGQVVAFRDPQAGGSAYAATTPSGLLLIAQDSQGNWTVRNLTQEIPGATPITSGLVTLTTVGGLVIVAGIDGSGDLVIYGQTTQRDAQGRVVWAFDNLSDSQLAPRGLATPAFHRRLIAYVTPWNGLNIAGLDSSGDIRVVWTAPGLAGWMADNLSGITGAPMLTGGLSAYITPWGGINLAGVDAEGDTVVTWWVPGFGAAWRHNDFTDQFGGPRLQANSITSYVTPWGGLNIAGLDDDGGIVIYWWVPGFTSWRLSPLVFDLPDRREHPTRRLNSFVGDDGSLNLLASGSFGDVLHLHWRPGASWEMDNLTGAVSGS